MKNLCLFIKINNVLKSIDDMFGFSFLSDGEL